MTAGSRAIPRERLQCFCNSPQSPIHHCACGLFSDAFLAAEQSALQKLESDRRS
jgi:hypothetical protein